MREGGAPPPEACRAPEVLAEREGAEGGLPPAGDPPNAAATAPEASLKEVPGEGYRD